MCESKFQRVFFLIVVFIGVTFYLTACNRPTITGTPTPDLNEVSTSAAETIAAQIATITSQQQAEPSATQPQLTFTQDQPTIVQLSSPTFPSVTKPVTAEPPEPETPTISAQIETNCRKGPSIDYDVIGYLLVGQESTVHGKSSSNNWWYIKNPKNSNQFCWVWAETTSIHGNTQNLPVVTPPPLPTATTFSFQASFSNIHNCGGKPTIIFQIGNDGDIGLESSGILIKDIATGIVLYGADTKNAPFLGSQNDCPPGLDNLGPGGVAFIGAVIQTPLPTEGSGRAKIVICSEPSLQGVCTEIKVDFPWQ